MSSQQLPVVPEFYQDYLDQVSHLSMPAALHLSLEALNDKLQEKLLAIGSEVYEEGKWTVSTILQHLIDTERIMTCRALRFARRDDTPLPGFDENYYAAHTVHQTRPVSELLEELKLVRVSGIYFFSSLSEEQLMYSGKANDSELSVLALGYIIAGHQMHHLKVIDERYLPLAKGIISPF